jgi:acyl-CoA synthetase (AMP-forming)/AMP-acid ligase II
MSHHPQPRLAEEKQPLASIIGVPHRHTKFVVSDDAFTRILPANQVGEVCIGGPQVGRGYVGGLFHISYDFTMFYWPTGTEAETILLPVASQRILNLVKGCIEPEIEENC